LSLQPFENPYCDEEGNIFDLGKYPHSAFTTHVIRTGVEEFRGLKGLSNEMDLALSFPVTTSEV
jgi:hypothetical protein